MGTYCILYIDDDAMSLKVIGDFLRSSGYEVILAEDGQEGLSSFASHIPDVVLLDLRMPQMDGFEVLKRIRAENQEIPILVISGVGDMEDVIKAVRFGATNYVIKSLDNLSVLSDVVDMAVRNLELARENQRAQERLASAMQENEFYRTQLESIFNSLPDGILTVDVHGNVLKFNHSIQSNCHFDSDLVPGQSLHELRHHKTGQCCLRLLEYTLRENQQILNQRVECPCLKPQHMRKVNLATTVTLRDEQGQVTGAILIVRDISRQERLEEELQERRQFRNIIGKSQSMQQVYEMIRKLANVDSTVLITGESGTGKEGVMEALHYVGHRSGGPLCRVNCSALSEELLDSELFGHVKGAFTGAHKDKIGRFETAHKGTIFLDEIGECSPRIQLKLLRVLETKSFERVGSSKTVTVDVRIISATNADLEKKISQGLFREDLYYRLKVLNIFIPPLRERKEDIPLLVDHFCRHFSQEFQKEILGVSKEVMNILFNYDWPGNIRELKHAMEHGCLLSHGGEIFVDHLPRELIEFDRSSNMEPKLEKSRKVTREDLEQALARSNGNKVRAAQLLGIHRKTLYRKLHQLSMPLK